MKRNITLSLDERLLKRARAFAAQRGTSVSSMLADELRGIIERETVYAPAKEKALAQLDSPFPIGGKRIASREELHDRQGLR